MALARSDGNRAARAGFAAMPPVGLPVQCSAVQCRLRSKRLPYTFPAVVPRLFLARISLANRPNTH
jgi:hypothetical protein